MCVCVCVCVFAEVGAEDELFRDPSTWCLTWLRIWTDLCQSPVSWKGEHPSPGDSSVWGEADHWCPGMEPDSNSEMSQGKDCNHFCFLKVSKLIIYIQKDGFFWGQRRRKCIYRNHLSCPFSSCRPNSYTLWGRGQSGGCGHVLGPQLCGNSVCVEALRGPGWGLAGEEKLLLLPRWKRTRELLCWCTIGSQSVFVK